MTEEISYTDDQIADFSARFHIRDDRMRDSFFFPSQSFLENGYAPPGGYVKDFSIIKHEGRYHLFHIDGRPEERCIETGNEIAFGHASTADFRHWIRHRMPLSVGERPWESEHIWAPYVHKRGDLFYMFYMGCGPAGTFISYATSPDLEKWTRREAGPIEAAVGRDPYVYDHGGKTILVFTGHGGARICAVSSEDMDNWQPMPDLITIPGRAATESSSVHRIGERWVLWLNDYFHTRDAGGDFRFWYAFSDDPGHFELDDIRLFDFSTNLPSTWQYNDWLEKKPVPISMELVERGPNVWLVCYFRWHLGRFRLFFGRLDWSASPAAVTEINNEEQLRQVLSELG